MEHAAADLGAKLRHARERHSASLSQIANSTKIPVSTLEALESNDISRLPAGVYGRGFVRSFATAVGLDPEAAVAEFVAQLSPDSQPAGLPTSERIEKDQTFETNHLIGLTPLRLTAVGVPIVAFVALIVYFGVAGRWHKRADAPSKVEIVLSADRTSVQSAVVAVPETPTSPTSPSTPADGAAPAVQSRAPGLANAPAVAPADPKSSAGAKTAEKAPVTEPIGDQLAVTLSVTRPGWVIATVDGKRTVSRLFQVGDEETLEVRHDLVLTAADAGAIVMTLNGAEARSIGETGETVKVRIDRTNFKKYLAPE